MSNSIKIKEIRMVDELDIDLIIDNYDLAELIKNRQLKFVTNCGDGAWKINIRLKIGDPFEENHK